MKRIFIKSLISLLFLYGIAGVGISASEAKASTNQDDTKVSLSNTNSTIHWLTDTTYKFSGLDVTLDCEIHMASIAVDSGSFELPTNAGYTNYYKNNDEQLSSLTEITLLFSGDKIGKENVLSTLESIVFTIVDETIEQNVTFYVDGNKTVLPTGSTITFGDHIFSSLNGHYYMWVTSYGGTWLDAYNAAQTYYYRGLRGYLATITSQEEDKVLDKITRASGWTAGVRTSLTSNFDANSYENINEVINETSSTWKWMCGPEAGTSFSEQENERATPVNEAYNSWATNEPNNYYDGASQDPTNGNYEYCMTTHFINNEGVSGWNDFANDTSDNKNKGFFVEFSDDYAKNEVENNKLYFSVQNISDKPSINYTATEYNQVYDGAAHGITVETSVSNATIKYGTIEGTYNLDASPTRTDVGETEVFFKITALGYADVTGSKKIIITKANINVDTPNIMNYTSADEKLAIHFNVDNNGTITVTSSDETVATATYDSNTKQILINRIKNGECNITITVVNGTNYNTYTKTIHIAFDAPSFNASTIILSILFAFLLIILLVICFYILWKYSIIRGKVANTLIRWMDKPAVRICKLFNKQEKLFTVLGTKTEQKEKKQILDEMK